MSPGKSRELASVNLQQPVTRLTLPAPEELARLILAGDRAALSRGVTLVESTAAKHQSLAAQLLKLLESHSGRAKRVGISGVPGAGKSTLLNRLGHMLCERGSKVAVLAVDPSSSVSRGSILGDKTRMDELSRHPNAFIRPSATGGELGGVARRTRQAIALCEAAGYDVVFVETVGVGQSETAVHELVDCFVLVALAGAGDELQGIKRGILELTDLVLVNKADGANALAAERARTEYELALGVLRGSPGLSGRPRPTVLACSALTGLGIEAAWDAIAVYTSRSPDDADAKVRRSEQSLGYFRDLLGKELLAWVAKSPAFADALRGIEASVAEGAHSPEAAVGLAMDRLGDPIGSRGSATEFDPPA